MGYAIIGLAVMIGIGLVILTTLGNNVGGTANTTIQTVAGYLGTSNGGLASWVPIIIVLVIGMLFLGAFLGKKGAKS
jgi:multisubunit Na+/H+ antiporter MnhB subunit